MTTNSYTYRVADLVFRLHASHFYFRGLKPFATSTDEKAVLELHYAAEIRTVDPAMKLLDTFPFPDADATCRLYSYEGGYLFTMQVETTGQEVRFDIPDGTDAYCNFAPEDDVSLFRFGLWITFNIHAIHHGVVAIHSSVVTYRQAAILCLGESGTGKSTHTRLWREHIEGAGLLNDDSPFVRIVDDEARVYGSPWSGKTPCYRNLCCRIAAFLRLSQAPENQIKRLHVLQAYGALQPSCPPSFVHDERLFDAVNRLLSELLRRVVAYHLACLPNREAAELSRSTIFNETADNE